MKRAHARAAFVVVVLLAASSCEDPKSHVFVAQLYEPARDCVDPSTGVDIVPTGEAGLTCAPTCLVIPSPPAPDHEEVYVATMCGPYPPYFDTSGTDPACPAALAAFARTDTCAGDGTSSNPVDGGESDAGDDAGDDANDASDTSDAGEDATITDAASDARDAGAE